MTRTIQEVTREGIDEIKRQLNEPEKYRPTPTNLKVLDEKIHGLKDGMYISLLGQAKKGKSALSQHLAAVLSMNGRGKVAYFLLEEVATQLGIRILVRSTSKTSRSDIYALDLTDENIEDMEHAFSLMQDMSFYVCDDVFTIDQIIALALANEYKYIIIDYVQLLNEKDGENESAKLSNISKKLIQARNVHGLTIIAVWQLNDQDKVLSSRAAMRDADLLIKVDVFKDETKQPIDGLISVEVLPSRQHGGTERLKVFFDGSHNLLYNNPPALDLEQMLLEGEEYEYGFDKQPADDIPYGEED